MASSDMGAWVPSATTAVQCTRPSADALFDGLEEQGQRAVPGAVGDDHAQRATGQVQCGDLARARTSEPPRVRGPVRAPPASPSLAPPPGPLGPSVVNRCSMDATSAANAVSPSDPSAAAELPEARRTGRRHGDPRRSDPAGGEAPRHAPRRPPTPAIQMAATMANLVVSSDLARRAATTGSRRWGNLLDPSAPTCDAGVAESRVGESPQRLVGECRGLQRWRERGHLERLVRRAPARSERRRDLPRPLRWWRTRPAGRRTPRRSAGR